MVSKWSQLTLFKSTNLYGKLNKLRMHVTIQGNPYKIRHKMFNQKRKWNNSMYLINSRKWKENREKETKEMKQIRNKQ